MTSDAGSDFSNVTKNLIALAARRICSICMTTATSTGNAFHVIEERDTMAAKIVTTELKLSHTLELTLTPQYAESVALRLDIVGRSDQRNGLWLCESCHQRISCGRVLLCPPSQLIAILLEAVTSNPTANIRQIIQQLEAVPWLNYYLLIVPNIAVKNVAVFPTRRPRKYNFVNNIGFTKRTKSNASDPGETYLIYKTSAGPISSSSKIAIVDLARDEERFRRLWYIPQIDIVNVMMMAFWNVRLADVDASSHQETMRDLARLYMLLWQRKLDMLPGTSSIVVDDDDDDDDEEEEDEDDVDSSDGTDGSENDENGAIHDEEMKSSSSQDQNSDDADDMNDDAQSRGNRTDPTNHKKKVVSRAIDSHQDFRDKSKQPLVSNGIEVTERFMWGPQSTSNDKVICLGGVPLVGPSRLKDDEVKDLIESRVRQELRTYGIKA
ncbi:hypothetical protein B0H16DRAFT_1469466 [Mycena metata]|uniref:Uncharacterized protein n=1 Tax=Mycena metata TaxID=1033252 RepID=A0AAD7HY02_9AGAR|nr:hypothetical protein B0H16DRAFT_1469466 [Mycena metata]